MGFGQLTSTQRLLLLLHIRNTDRELYNYIETIIKMKKILPVICPSGDVQAIRATQVPGTTVTVGDVSTGGCTNCDYCYGILSTTAMKTCITVCAICDSANS